MQTCKIILVLENTLVKQILFRCMLINTVNHIGLRKVDNIVVKHIFFRKKK